VCARACSDLNSRGCYCAHTHEPRARTTDGTRKGQDLLGSRGGAAQERLPHLTSPEMHLDAPLRNVQDGKTRGIDLSSARQVAEQQRLERRALLPPPPPPSLPVNRTDSLRSSEQDTTNMQARPAPTPVHGDCLLHLDQHTSISIAHISIAHIYIYIAPKSWRRCAF
jgi:hypothetical protein